MKRLLLCNHKNILVTWSRLCVCDSPDSCARIQPFASYFARAVITSGKKSSRPYYLLTYWLVGANRLPAIALPSAPAGNAAALPRAAECAPLAGARWPKTEAS